MGKSKIQWTGDTWNPTTGCDYVSIGCRDCYAKKQAIRLQAMGTRGYENGFKLTCHDHRLNLPLKWLKPRLVFVNSMSDLFHEKVPDDFILKVFDVMNKCPQHTFQILTKRARRLHELNHKLKWTDNIWMGVTVEALHTAGRVSHLILTDAKLKFISFEPLLENIIYPTLRSDDNLMRQNTLIRQIKDHIGWVIVGGENGYSARKMYPGWASNIGALCEKNKIPFFFKQMGGRDKDKGGALLYGRTYKQMPPGGGSLL